MICVRRQPGAIVLPKDNTGCITELSVHVKSVDLLRFTVLTLVIHCTVPLVRFVGPVLSRQQYQKESGLPPRIGSRNNSSRIINFQRLNGDFFWS